MTDYRMLTRVHALNSLVGGENSYSSERSFEEARRALATLFQFKDWDALKRAHAAGDIDLDTKLKMIGGPNGYTIYKAMKAKQDAT